MTSSQNQKGKKNPGRIIILAIVGLTLIFTIVPRAKNIYELSMRRDDLLQQRQVLNAKHEELNSTLQKSLQPEQVEKIAREKLGMIKPGEMYVVPVEND